MGLQETVSLEATPQKLGQHTLICVNWPNAVLFPGQECVSRSKPKGISDLTIPECMQDVAALQDSGPHRLHFKFKPNSKWRRLLCYW